MVTLREDVERFLNEFKVKMDVFDIIFVNRKESKMSLLSMGLTFMTAKEVIKSLEVEDYSDGPIRSQLMDWKEMWVFGKDIDGNELSIKIALSLNSANTYCISFHKAEHPMKYPLKDK